MVQEKDAAKKRAERMRNFLAEEAKELDSKTIGRRWFVIEHTPRWSSNGGWDQDIPEENVIVSKYFETEQGALDWLDRHEPDEGKELRLGSQRLIEETTRRWI